MFPKYIVLISQSGAETTLPVYLYWTIKTTGRVVSNGFAEYYACDLESKMHSEPSKSRQCYWKIYPGYKKTQVKNVFFVCFYYSYIPGIEANVWTNELTWKTSNNISCIILSNAVIKIQFLQYGIIEQPKTNSTLINIHNLERISVAVVQVMPNRSGSTLMSLTVPSSIIMQYLDSNRVYLHYTFIAVNSHIFYVFSIIIILLVLWYYVKWVE